MSSKIEAQVLECIATLPKTVEKLIVAYSGGLDSSVLLHLLATNVSVGKAVEVLHINHQLSAHASVWENHCRDRAKYYNLPYHVETIAISKQGQGLEAAARTARHMVFKKYAKSNCAILTAHHADDQAETVMLRILRGTGIRGLAAIPAQRRLNQGFLLRPLLKATRNQLEWYAKCWQLSFITDESNFDYKFTRNLVRHRIFPDLKRYFHDVSQQLINLQTNANEADQLLTEYAATLFVECKLPDKKQLNLTKLKRLSSSQQRLVLRYWLVNLNNLIAPTRQQLLMIQGGLVFASIDKQPIVKLGNLLCRRYGESLYLIPVERPDCRFQYFNWDLRTVLLTPSGKLDPQLVRRNVNLPKNPILSVRYRQGGERFHPAGRVGSHPLKKCFQEWRIPPWERDFIPLLYFNDELIYVYDHMPAEGWQMTVSS